MAIDQTPSVVATNALQSLPFSSLIGGPLDACIKAQAASAKTSWEFIDKVGLYTDPKTGEKKAVQVTFQYNNNGHMTKLVVPLLTIVPIPYMAIDQVTIDFIANISASSSSTTQSSDDKSLKVDASADASFGIGPFSINVKAEANYSSKQHSAASQSSKYSVEYTMNVHVEGGQADMPPGLGTILNILQGSITSNGSNDMISITPSAININGAQGQTGADIKVQIKNSKGEIVKDGVVVKAFIQPISGPSLTLKTKNQGDSLYEASSFFLSAPAKLNATHPKRIQNKLAQGRFLTPAEEGALSYYKSSLAHYPYNDLIGQTSSPSPTDSDQATTNDDGIVRFVLDTSTAKPGTYTGNIEFDATIKGSGKTKDEKITKSARYMVIVPKPPQSITNESTLVAFTKSNPTQKLKVVTEQNGMPVKGVKVEGQLSNSTDSSLITLTPPSTLITGADGSLEFSLEAIDFTYDQQVAVQFSATMNDEPFGQLLIINASIQKETVASKTLAASSNSSKSNPLQITSTAKTLKITASDGSTPILTPIIPGSLKSNIDISSTSIKAGTGFTLKLKGTKPNPQKKGVIKFTSAGYDDCDVYVEV